VDREIPAFDSEGNTNPRYALASGGAYGRGLPAWDNSGHQCADSNQSYELVYVLA